MEFKKHYSRGDLEKLFDGGFRLPDDFLFGVANAGFQVEGGYNGPGEPLNNWAILERSGKVEPSGEAARFWEDYATHIALAEKMGLNGFRVSIEWSRVQPRASLESSTVPPFDEKAIERYSDMLASVMNAGMEPVVTLQHFTHPYWTGIDFWLDNRKLDLFRKFVEEVAREVNRLLVEKHGLKPVRYWVTINEPNGLSFITYMLRQFPHRKGGLMRTLAAWDNMIDAHCRAYDAVHRVYRVHEWPDPMVSYNTVHISPYYLDKVMTDMLLARRNGVKKSDLAGYLERGQAAWNEELSRSPEVWRAPRVNRELERFVEWLTARTFRLDRFRNGVNAIYSSPEPDKLDFLAVDYYDPWLRNMLKMPSIKDFRERRLGFNAELWEQVLNPAGMYSFLKAESINAEGLPIYILESGMCYRVRGGRAEPRYDGATMDLFLQCYLYETMRALKDGMPTKGYFYWTMTDNYEWGSYEPRFGLYGIDRTQSPVSISETDAMGVNAGGAYATIIAALRSGDRERIIEAFT